MPGIKVDKGPIDIPSFPGEVVTEGLDGLRGRVKEYKELGAKFAKWRAVITIGEGIPTYTCIEANAHALARYAALCQEGGLVPIVEPEVLLDGSHTVERCEEVTEQTLKVTFAALFLQRIHLEGMILKPSMVVSGKDNPRQAGVEEVAERTLRCLKRTVPAAVPGIAFLSGGQSAESATEHLNAMNAMGSPSVASELLLRARLAGSSVEGVERRGCQCAGGAENFLSSRQVQQRCPERSVQSTSGSSRVTAALKIDWVRCRCHAHGSVFLR